MGKHKPKTCPHCERTIKGGQLPRHKKICERGRKRTPKGRGRYEGPKKCPHCVRFIWYGNLQRHIKRNHPESTTISSSGS